jgi:hypothetical protein
MRRTRQHAWAASVAAALAIAGTESAIAEGFEVMQSELQPVMETSRDHIDLCGVHFSLAGRTVSGRLLGLQGTVYSSYYAGKIPGVLLKVSAVEFIGETLERRNVRFAAFFDNDRINTAAFSTLPSEDGASYLAHADMNQSPDAMEQLQNKLLFGGIWLSFNLGDTKSDYTVRFDGSQDHSELAKEVARCNLRGLEQIQRELGGAQ